MDEIDVEAKLTDYFIFDDESNVQTAGAILCAQYPHAIYFHGGEHGACLALFFSNLSKIKPIQVSSIFLHCLLCLLLTKIFSCLFPSAVGCIVFSVLEQAMEYTPSSLLNPALSTVEKIGLLHGAGTRFATWFYSMHRAL